MTPTKRGIVLGALLAIGGVALTVAALQQPLAGQEAPRVVEAEQLKDNLFLLTGGGGNSSAFVTEGGVVVVDTKNPGWGQPLLDAIGSVTDKPVTMIINTHTHGDHVSGNVEFAENIEIVAHENTRTNMQEMRPNSSAAPSTTPPLNIFRDNGGRGMPTQTFTDRMTIGSGRDQIDLHYFGRSHTNGDAMVVFPAHRVMHIADAFPAMDMPIMDANNGGTGVGYADTLEKASAFVDGNIDTLISGHSATTTTPADLKRFIQFVRGYVSDAQAAKRDGKTVDAFADAWMPPAGFTARQARVRSNARLIFDETR
ncbi:MAG: MBL fold metallo-hydrolase [Acidobacteria bacterium]|nr:MBL fold metallo-hydrolase [Acidobacteriota bacterium]